jgi:hypothetical protein
LTKTDWDGWGEEVEQKDKLEREFERQEKRLDRVEVGIWPVSILARFVSQHGRILGEKFGTPSIA